MIMTKYITDFVKMGFKETVEFGFITLTKELNEDDTLEIMIQDDVMEVDLYLDVALGDGRYTQSSRQLNHIKNPQQVRGFIRSFTGLRPEQIID